MAGDVAGVAAWLKAARLPDDEWNPTAEDLARDAQRDADEVA
jgi:hypothetical protein